MKLISIVARIIAPAAFLLGVSIAARAQSGAGVLTHHNDFRRTGWNYAETILTPDSISSASNNFGVIATVNNLDDTVYAQPLILPNVQITCPPNQTIITCQTGLSGLYNVVYVATVANTVYAINAVNGQILLSRNFGFRGNCNGGIKSTPVIDPISLTLYVMTHTSNGVENGPQIHTLHALNVGTLSDSVTPAVISNYNTFHTLTDGTFYQFNSSISCQRAALLLVGGNIYAGFGGQEFSSGSPNRNSRGPRLAFGVDRVHSCAAPTPADQSGSNFDEQLFHVVNLDGRFRHRVRWGKPLLLNGELRSFRHVLQFRK